jgi:hypothetical protein
MVKGYARGGAAKTPAAPKSERKEMARVMRETSSERKGAGAEVKRVSREESYDQAKVSSPAKPARKAYPAHSNVPMIALKKGGMIPSTGKLGVVNNKNPGETKKHTAPDLAKPKTMMKSGGSVKKMAKGGAPKAGLANSPKLQAMTQMAAQGAALAAQKNATSQQPMPRPGLAVDPAPPRPRGFDNVGSGGIGKDVKGVKGGPAGPIDPRTGGGQQQMQQAMDRFRQEEMMRNRGQQVPMQQMLQTNRPAGMGMGQQGTQATAAERTNQLALVQRERAAQMAQMAQMNLQPQQMTQQMTRQLAQDRMQQDGAPTQIGTPIEEAVRLREEAIPRGPRPGMPMVSQPRGPRPGMGMGQQVAQQMPQTQMQSQQQMAQQRPQVPMQQAQPMKKGGMTYKKK